MSLKHAFTDLIADDPALPTFVRPSNWNEEHTFPGAGAGEVVYVDGAGHAATSADLMFDAGSKTIRISGQDGVGNLILSASFGAGAVVALQVASWDVNDETKLSIAVVSSSSGFIGADNTGAATTPPITSMTIGYKDGVGGDTPQLSFPLASGGWYMFAGSFEPFNENAQDLGFNAPLRTGYFGTSVVSPAFDLTGAATGGVWYTDGDGHAATSADFTFDAGTLGVSGEIRAYFWHPDDDNYDFGAITPGGFLRNQIGTGTAQTFMSIGLSQDTPTAGSVVTYQNGNGGWGMGSSADTAPNAWYPFSDNAQDLGGVTATVGSDFRLRTGYFGTSVVSPLFVAGTSPGITTTVTTASLVGKTITITGGIITGFA